MILNIFVGLQVISVTSVVDLLGVNGHTKMNSLYQIRSKILHGTKVIIFGEKNRKRVGQGFKLMTFVLEGEDANHYTMDP